MGGENWALNWGDRLEIGCGVSAENVIAGVGDMTMTSCQIGARDSLVIPISTFNHSHSHSITDKHKSFNSILLTSRLDPWFKVIDAMQASRASTSLVHWNMGYVNGNCGTRSLKVDELRQR